MKSFAVVLVCYNRLGGVRRLLKSLETADYAGRNDIHLIFSIDRSGSDEIEQFAKEYTWKFGEKHIRTFPERQGLKKHILSCGDFTEQYDIVTILEDDIYLSSSFYRYAYAAADFYFDDDNVAGISLYGFQKNWLDWVVRFEPQKYGEFDTYFMKIAQSWGEVWTNRKWAAFKEWLKDNEDFKKDNEDVPYALLTFPESSWLKYHDKYLIKADKYFVYPYYSYSTNFSDTGEHANFCTTDHQVELMYGKTEFKFPEFNEKSIKYDQYMNREGLEEYLGVKKEDLCVDFWGTKPKSDKRYLLSIDFKPYKAVKSYQLSLRPIEMAVINGIKGNGIYLYDTFEKADGKRFNGKFRRYKYSIRAGESKKIRDFALWLRVYDLTVRIKGKINRKIKKS